VEDFEVGEEGAAAGGGELTEDGLHAGFVAGGDFAPEGAALGGEDEDDLAAVLGVFGADDEAVADHAVEDDGGAGLADEEEFDKEGLFHFSAAVGEEVEDIELGAGEAVGLEEGIAAAFEEALHKKEGDEKIVGSGLAFHATSIRVDRMMSNCFILNKSFRIYAIRGVAGAFHLLCEAERREAVLIDTGLAGELPKLERTLREAGLAWADIKAILLTHGHLDHTGNLARVKEPTGAPVQAHAREQAHIDGRFPYRGASRLCGAMEAVGRGVFGYRPVAIDLPLTPEEELPYWGGLRVVHLPGHTAGHCGFYSDRFELLFSGDLFASYWFSTHPPPVFLNSCGELMATSVERVKALRPRYLIPNHYDKFDGDLHRRRFEAWTGRQKGQVANAL